MKFKPGAEDIAKSERLQRAKGSPFDVAMVFTYMAKVRQADLFKANPNIAKAEIPHITAEAEATGQTPAKVVAAILTEHRVWATRDARIEAGRLKRKKNQGA